VAASESAGAGKRLPGRSHSQGLVPFGAALAQKIIPTLPLFFLNLTSSVSMMIWLFFIFEHGTI
jgi:hypothetical protein